MRESLSTGARNVNSRGRSLLSLAPPQGGAVTIPAGEEQATVVADQLQQVGGATDLMIAVGNVEITRGQTRLLADLVEINRDTGQAVATAWSANVSTTT